MYLNMCDYHPQPLIICWPCTVASVLIFSRLSDVPCHSAMQKAGVAGKEAHFPRNTPVAALPEHEVHDEVLKLCVHGSVERTHLFTFISQPCLIRIELPTAAWDTHTVPFPNATFPIALLERCGSGGCQECGVTEQTARAKIVAQHYCSAVFDVIFKSVLVAGKVCCSASYAIMTVSSFASDHDC